MPLGPACYLFNAEYAFTYLHLCFTGIPADMRMFIVCDSVNWLTVTFDLLISK